MFWNSFGICLSAKKPVALCYWYSAWRCERAARRTGIQTSDSGHSGSRAPGGGRWMRQAVTTRQGP